MPIERQLVQPEDLAALQGARSALFAARILSQAAKTLLYAALFVASVESFTATGLSAIVVAIMAGAILFAIPGGILADRLGPPKTLTAGTLVRLATVFGAFAVVAEPSLAWAAALLFSAASQPYTQAELAVVRSVEPLCSNRTHASIVLLQHIGHGAGLLLAPLLYLLAGEAALIAGAALLLTLVLPATLHVGARLSETALPWRPAPSTTLDLAGTLRFFAADRRARYAATTLAYADLATKALLVAAPVYLAADLDASTGATGSLLVVAGAGVLLGLLWSGRVLGAGFAPHALRSVLLLGVAASLTLAGLGHSLGGAIQLAGLGALPLLSSLTDGALPSLVVAFPAVFALGAAFSAAPVAARTVLTEAAPHAEQARVFASVSTLSDVAVILPLALTGVSADLIGARPTLLLLGIVGAIALAFFELGDTERSVPGAAPAGAPLPSP